MAQTHAPLTPQTLIKIFQVCQSTLNEWNRSGVLVPGPSGQYDWTATEQLLRAGAVNFAQPPSLTDLLENRLVLISAGQARAILQEDPQYLLACRQKGLLPGVKLRRNWRYSRAHIETIEAQTHDTTRFRPLVVRHILGIGSKGALTRLIALGKLIKVDNSQEAPLARTESITRDSLVQLLSELLPPWITPDSWIDERLASTRRLVPARQAAEQLGVDLAGFYARFGTENTLRYIGHFSRKNWLASPESLDTLRN